MAQKSKYLLLVLVTLSLIETLFFGGVIFGWSSLVFVYKSEGLFADLCDDNSNSSKNVSKPDGHKINCVEQDERLNLLFSIGAGVVTIGNILIGYLKYKFGARINGLAGILCYVSGALFFGFANQDIPWLILPGIVLNGIGGFIVFVNNMMIATLISSGGDVYIGLVCGCFDSSVLVTLIVKTLHGLGVDYLYTFIGLAIASVPIVGTSKVMFHYVSKSTFPVEVQMELTVNREPPFNIELRKNNITDDKRDTGMTGINKIQKNSHASPLSTILRQPLFWTNIMWMSILKLRFLYFIGESNRLINSILETRSEVSFYTDLMSYVMLGGIVTSFVAGGVRHWQTILFKENQDETKKKLLPNMLPILITSLLAISLSCASFFKTTGSLIISFVFLVCLRSFMYSVNISFLLTAFPTAYFGLTHGMVISFAGAISLSINGIFIWAESYPGADQHVYGMLLGLSLISCVHPITLLLKSRK